MTTYDYQYTEALLLRLLSLLVGVFSNSEKGEVQNFIEAGEYGLALETLVDIVIEENKQISSEILMLVNELAGVMQLDKNVYEEKLHGHITGR